MRCVGILNGGAPVMKRFQLSATATVLGVPYLASASNAAGLSICTTTGVTDMVGINLDLATYATAQGATSPEALITVIINPDAVYEIDMSGGAAAGTAQTTRTVTSASASGLAVTTNTDWTSPETDESSIWGITGANAGQFRKITSTSSTAATVTVAFASDTAVGDTFGYAPVLPWTLQTVTLTTELNEFRQDVAVATNTAKLFCIEMPVNDFLGSTRRPFGRFMARDHILNPES